MKHVLALAVIAIVATILYSIVSGNERKYTYTHTQPDLRFLRHVFMVST